MGWGCTGKLEGDGQGHRSVSCGVFIKITTCLSVSKQKYPLHGVSTWSMFQGEKTKRYGRLLIQTGRSILHQALKLPPHKRNISFATEEKSFPFPPSRSIFFFVCLFGQFFFAVLVLPPPSPPSNESVREAHSSSSFPFFLNFL